MEQMKQILSFVRSYSTAAPQGSAKWLKGRNRVIGGSEVAAVMGLNPYSDFNRVLMSKLDLSTFTGNNATRWGNLFELAHEHHVYRLFDWPVQHVGSVNGVCPGHKYSPDGLVVGRIGGRDIVLLLEFKSPFTTWPNGQVPVHYMPQVQMGLADIDMCEKGLFINSVYRRCAAEQWAFNADYVLNGAKEKPVDTTPAAMGVFFFSKRGACDHQRVDYGRESIDALLEGLSRKSIKPTLHQMFVFERPDFVENFALDDPEDLLGWIDDAWSTFLEECAAEGRTAIGFMPWKLIKYDAILVDRDYAFIEEAVLHITEAVKILEEIFTEKSPIQKYYTINRTINATLKENVATAKKRSTHPPPQSESSFADSSSDDSFGDE